MSARAVARLGGVLLGALVFVAALAIWEAWARSAESFFLPPASEVALRAWDVWPSAGFLSAVGASLKRLSAGYAIARYAQRREPGVKVSAVIGGGLSVAGVAFLAVSLA